MNKSRLLTCVCACFFTIYGPPISAVTITVDFASIPEGEIAGDSLTITTAGIDVTFSGQGLVIRGLGDEFISKCGFTKYLSTSPNDDEPITVTFSGGFTTDSMTILNPINGTVDDEVDTIFAQALDLSDSLITSTTSSAEFITLSASGIAKAIYDDVSTGYVIGSLQFNAVPIPAALWLFSSGLLALIRIPKKKVE